MMQNESNRRALTPPRWRPRDAQGYVLLVFSLFAALLLIGMYRMLPNYIFEGQRIKEQELIFRGRQYVRGIQLFVRKFGRYPTSLEELENTNEIRFLRKLYRDPMTDDGEWRLVHIGPNGTFYDSIHLTGGPSSASDSSSSEGNSSEQSTPDPFDLTSQNSGSARPSSGEQASNPAIRASSNPNPTQQPRASASVQATQTVGGGGIAGVASKNEGEGIKVVGGYTHYNEWEFVYDYRTDPLGLAAVNRVSGVPQQQPQQPNQPGQQTPGRGQQPVGRNPLTGQPIGVQTPGTGITGGPGSIPGGPTAPRGQPTWRGGPPPTTDPFGRR